MCVCVYIYIYIYIITVGKTRAKPQFPNQCLFLDVINGKGKPEINPKNIPLSYYS